MKERKGIFKDYSIDKFWPIFISQIIDNMYYAKIIGAGNLTKQHEIFHGMAELLWPLYEKVFISKYKFFLYINITAQGILDAYESGNDEIYDVKKVFEFVKKNWNKNKKYIYKMTD